MLMIRLTRDVAYNMALRLEIDYLSPVRLRTELWTNYIELPPSASHIQLRPKEEAF